MGKVEEQRLVRFLDYLLNIKCGYCLDGEDCGADVCPECGAAQIEDGEVG